MLILLTVTLCFSVLSCLGICLLLFIKFKEKGGVKRVLKPSEELADFLADIRRSGYGIVRVDPDTVMRRSPR